MKKIRVGVAGYGTIGQRLADGVALQDDMELVGIADLAPTLSIRALAERDMLGVNNVRYNLYLVDGADKAAFDTLGIPVAGSFEQLLDNVDIILEEERKGRFPGRRKELRGGCLFPRIRQLRKGIGRKLPEADFLQHDRFDPRRGLP